MFCRKYLILYIGFYTIISKVNTVDKLPMNSNKNAGHFDLSKDLDFCAIKCHNAMHVACNCRIDNSAICYPMLSIDETITFRQLVLLYHNKYRNKVASGEEKNSTLGEASNMNAVSYDLALEYVAMCSALKCDLENNFCRLTKKFPSAIQNIYTYNTQGPGNYQKLAEESIAYWYAENELLSKPEIIDSLFLSPDEEKPWTHLTAMLWWSVTHIGCAITTTSLYNQLYYHMVICVYGSPDIETGAINMLGQSVYKRSKAASECSNGTTPNDLFPALCGKIELIPTADPIHHNGGSYAFNNLVFIKLCIFISFLNVFNNVFLFRF